jgi:glycosyltransferase involved in cell wall biosynthesis
MYYPKITVLMSVYNGSTFLRDAIESVLNQTFNDFELLIIDDGSTDNPLSIIDSFNDSRIRVISNSRNIGLTKSLNIGLTKARGVYIARMDADDASLLNRLEVQYRYFKDNPNVTLLGGGCYYIDSQNIVLREKLRKTGHEDIKFYCFFNNPFIHSSVMFKKDCLNTIGGYNEFYKYAQDYDLWSRWVDYYKVANLKQIVVKWRSTPMSISNAKRDKQARFGRRVSVNFYRKQLSGLDKIDDCILHAIRDDNYVGLSESNMSEVKFVVHKMVNKFYHVKDARVFGARFITHV